MKKIFFSLLIVTLFLGVLPVLAAEVSNVPEINQVTNEVLANTNPAADVTAADLGNVNTGWFSGVWRNVKIWFTSDPIKKANLELAKADVRLLKTKKLAYEKLNDPKLQTLLDQADTDYGNLMDKIKIGLIKAKTTNPNNPQLNKFLNKLTDHQFKHQEILERISSKVPVAVAQRIQLYRQRHLQKFGAVMNKLQNKVDFKKNIEESLTDVSVPIGHRIMRVKYIEELEKVDPELKAKIEEMKKEGQDTWLLMKTKHDAIVKRREGLKASIEQQLKKVNIHELLSNPAARHDLIESIRAKGQTVRTENEQLRTEAQEKMKEFREKHAPVIKELKEKRNSRLKELKEKREAAIKEAKEAKEAVETKEQ